MLAEVPVSIQAHEVASKAPYGHILAVFLDGEESRHTWLEVNVEEGFGIRYVEEEVAGRRVPIPDGGGDDRKPWLAAYPEGYETERVEGVFRMCWLRAF